MKTIFVKIALPLFFSLFSLTTFAGYWKCENWFELKNGCILHVTYEVWWSDETGEVTAEKTSAECDCCGVAGGPGKAFTADRIPGTVGYEAANFTFTSTGTPELPQQAMVDLWNDPIKPWILTLDRNNPETCVEE